MDEILTVSEAASVLHKHPGTVRSWIRSEKIKAKRVSSGGSGVYVLLKTDVLEYMVTTAAGHKESRPAPEKPVKPSPQVKLPL